MKHLVETVRLFNAISLNLLKESKWYNSVIFGLLWGKTLTFGFFQ